MACLTPYGIEKLKKMLTTKGSKLSELVRMESAKRKSVIEKHMGEENVEYINYSIEKKLVSKTTAPILNWAEKEITAPHQRADVLKRVGRLQDAINDKNSLELLTNDKAKEAYLEDLISHKIGISVTQEETAIIMDLALNADKARDDIKEIANTKTPYGKAHSLMARGYSEEEALKEAGTTKAEYKKVEDARAEAGAEVYKYTAFMDRMKQEADALKLADFGKSLTSATWELKKEVLESVRSIWASGDMGFLFRQGLKSLYKDPKVWAKNSLDAINNVIKGFKNVDFKAVVMAEIMTRPNYLSGHYQEAGLAINTVEDYYRNSWIERITDSETPNFFQNLGQRYMKMSQDTYLVYLYKMRADLFDAHFDKLQEAGAEYKGIGEFINNLTGRGSGMIAGQGGKTGIGSELFFSARYTQSQLNSFSKIASEKNATLKKEYIKNLASLVAGTASVLLMSSLMGFEVELDPKSTKFGRLILPDWLGGYVLDITGGLATIVVLLARIISRKTKTGKGEVKELGGFGRDNASDLVIRYFTNKGSPAMSIATTIIDDELYGGKELTTASFARSLTPIVEREITEKMTDEELNLAGKVLLSAFEYFGLGSYKPSSYGGKKKKTTSRSRNKK
jgi:hypothetical protein